MRQVPNQTTSFSYLIIGNGRLSRHLQHYFSLKGISFKIWTKDSVQSFKSLAINSSYILVLIKDDAIVPFIEQNNKGKLAGKIWIHCSGMLSTKLAESAHPLMTFADELYDLKFYESITFITEKNRLSFRELFPDLNNSFCEINSNEKVLYHAMCVLSGNLTSFLWKIFFDYLKNQNIPEKAGHVYLKAITNNLLNSYNPLTGPLQRNDKKVIAKHLSALEGLPLSNIYRTFADTYKMIKEN